MKSKIIILLLLSIFFGLFLLISTQPRPVNVVATFQDWHGMEFEGSEPIRWMGKNATIHFFSDDVRDVSVRFVATSLSNHPRRVELIFNNQSLGIVQVATKVRIKKKLTLQEGMNKVVINVNACEYVNDRCLGINIRNLFIYT